MWLCFGGVRFGIRLCDIVNNVSFLGAAGGTKTIDITYKPFANDGSNYGPSYPYWLSSSAELLADYSKTYTMRESYTVLANPSLTARNCSLNIYTDMGTVGSGTHTYETLTITQSGGSLYPETTNLSCWMNQSRKKLQIYASSRIMWKVSSNASWISFPEITKEIANANVDISIAKNTSGMRREGKITLYVANIRDTNIADYCKNPRSYLNEDWIASSWSSVASVSVIQDGCLTYSGSETSVQGPVTIDYSDLNGEMFEFVVNGTTIISSLAPGTFVWQPTSMGTKSISCTKGSQTWTSTFKVTSLAGYTQPEPNPPMVQDDKISITPTTRNFGVDGGGNAIITQGRGTWTAAASEPWITLNATSGTAGYPVAYTVSATTEVEQRVGYIYVSGWTHTVTQEGVDGTISPENKEFEAAGGNGSISVSTQNKMLWYAKSNAEWLSVPQTSGVGPGSVAYQCAPFNEVTTRQGTLTVAGKTFTVLQYGKRMKLDSYSTSQNYEAHVIPITVNALAEAQWSVTPNNSWISVVDAGNGQGGDLVTIAIAENPSYSARTGSVTIGTETFTVTQQGRSTDMLSFSVSPANSTASAYGANGIIAVTATPDLPWTATSGANWLAIYSATANGAGSGNVVY